MSATSVTTSKNETAGSVDDGQDPKPTGSRMALSSMCRDQLHKRCTEMRMRCSCACHDPNLHLRSATSSRGAGKPKAQRATPPRSGRPAPAGLNGRPQPVGNKLPVVALVKADPPALVKPPRVSLAELVRPLLEQILVDRDRDWYRCVLFFKDRQAAMNLKRLQDRYSKTEWEWAARKLEEVGQSAVYVRWVGKDGRLE